MTHFRLTLPAAGLLLAMAAQSHPAAAQTAPPSGLLGAWGSDSSCTSDVAVFRADGTVVEASNTSGKPITYQINGETISFTQDKKTGQFAFALGNEAVAWSNGATVVLKERCADQTAFAQQSGPQAPPASLFDTIRALAAEPLIFNGVPIKVVGIEGHTALSPTTKAALYSEVVAHPDPNLVGADADLLYRIFPTAKAAAAYVSLAVNDHDGFVYERRGAGFFNTATASDEGPGGAGGTPITIDCLRFHPKHTDSVTISCFAQMPGSRLVAGGRQSFPLPKGSKATELGPKDNLSETLDLTSLAIGKLRGFLAQTPNP